MKYQNTGALYEIIGSLFFMKDFSFITMMQSVFFYFEILYLSSIQIQNIIICKNCIAVISRRNHINHDLFDRWFNEYNDIH